MKKTDPKVQKYLNLEGYLEKEASGTFGGYQMRYWRVTDDGTRIGYSYSREEPPKGEKSFSIKDCLASESSGKANFELWTGKKKFFLKAATEEEMIDWVYGLSFLKKIINKEIKFKAEPSPTETTLASHSERCKTKKKEKIEPASSIKIERPRLHQPEDLSIDRPSKETQSNLIQDLSKYMTKNYLKYNTIITHLRVKTQGIFTSSFNSDVYVLISPKSLYPDIHIEEINLTNLSLPPWLEVNYFYRIVDGKEKKKEIFHVNKILEIEEGNEKCSLKINTGQVIYEFLTESIEQKDCLKNCLEIATVNAQEVNLKGKVSKRNFDKLIDLHETKLVEFEIEAKKLAQSFNKSEEDGHLPSVLCDFLNGSMIYLREFIEVLENKKKNKDHVVLDVLKEFHEEVKVEMKMTWDCCRESIKGVDILNILKKLSEYYDLMKSHIKSPEFYEGMKELSKIYVRESWKNFESIIINIVERERENSNSFFYENEGAYPQTYGVTDLFKFIYNVFEIAYPNWINKNHLHNVSKLMIKALQVFTNEIKLVVDEEEMMELNMIAIANNYFKFKEFVEDFYAEKLEKDLVLSTRDEYENLKERYHEISMAVLEKICSNVGYSIEEYCNKCTLQTLRCENIEDIIEKTTANVEKHLHIAFSKKFNEKIMKEVHLKVSGMVARITKENAKKRIIRCVEEIKHKLSTAFDQIYNTNRHFSKNMEQLITILNIDLYEDIRNIIVNSSEPVKEVYLQVLLLREDYLPNGSFYRIVNNETIEQSKELELKRNNRKSKNIDSMIRGKNVTLSRQYYQEEMYGSDENSLDDDKSKDSEKPKSRFGGDGHGDKMINEGYLIKGKPNQKHFYKNYRGEEKMFFRLRNEYLYAFRNADSDKCSYEIEIKTIIRVSIPNPSKPSFIVCYKTLTKEKEIKLKAETIDIRDKWVNSIELEMKKINKEEAVKKKKSVKYREEESVKKKQMIIDYWELERGKDYFSYSGS